MPNFPSTSLQWPETMTSSIGTLLRRSAGETSSHTEPFVLLFSFFWCYTLFLFYAISCFPPSNEAMRAWLQKEACFGKLPMRWKNDTISTLEPCTVLFPLSIQFYMPIPSSSLVSLPLKCLPLSLESFVSWQADISLLPFTAALLRSRNAPYILSLFVL